MDYMFELGFLGTRAPLFMDMVTAIVAILPFLVYGAIILARKKVFVLHTIVQNILFVVSVVVFGYFEYGVRIAGGFDAFMNDSSVSYTYALVVLLVHIAIATVTMFYWTMTILKGNYQFYKGLIPGKLSTAHKILAIKSFIGITATSFSGVWVYILMFVF